MGDFITVNNSVRHVDWIVLLSVFWYVKTYYSRKTCTSKPGLCWRRNWCSGHYVFSGACKFLKPICGIWDLTDDLDSPRFRDFLLVQWSARTIRFLQDGAGGSGKRSSSAQDEWVQSCGVSPRCIGAARSEGGDMASGRCGVETVRAWRPGSGVGQVESWCEVAFAARFAAHLLVARVRAVLTQHLHTTEDWFVAFTAHP